MHDRIRHEKWFTYNNLKFKAILTAINGEVSFELRSSPAAEKWLQEDEDNQIHVMVHVARLFKLAPPGSIAAHEQTHSRFLDRLTASVN